MKEQPKIVKEYSEQSKTITVPITICAASISGVGILLSWYFNLTDKQWWPAYVLLSLLVIAYSFWFDMMIDKKKDFKELDGKINFEKKLIINKANEEAKIIIDKANIYKADIEKKYKNITHHHDVLKNDIDYFFRKRESYLELIRVHKIRINNFRKNYNEETAKGVNKRKSDNVSQKKIDGYEKSRKNVYYTLDKLEKTVMEEKAIIRFIIEDLQNELIEIEEREH